ncbi:MAG: MarR family transcriptional regulator, partial [Solirubrobacterales bacterium]
ANYFWTESIKNINSELSESEVKKFSSQDYYYLTTIYYMNNPNFSEVAEKLNLTKPAISVIAAKLSKMGLLEKIQSKEDKRVYHMAVTKKGRRIVEGDEESYRRIEALIKNIIGDENKYKYIESILEEIVKKL